MLKASSIVLPLLIIGLSAGAQSATAQPAPATASCRSALTALAAEWNEIAFMAPGKPGQTIVTGREGYVTTGGDFNFMVGEIRLAHVACDRGDEASAMQDIAAVQDTLAHANRRKS
jgi:hypothetical protein